VLSHRYHSFLQSFVLVAALQTIEPEIMVRLRTSQELTTGWSVKQTDNASEDAWLPVLQVPTNVHLDLLANRKYISPWHTEVHDRVLMPFGLHRIPDPFVGFNELLVEWVGEKAWTYRVDLPARSQLAGALDGASVALVFEGLDTFARVRLNGETILESDNMFVPHRVDITHRLREENRLEIDFDSALLRAREIQKIHPDHKWVGFNGEPARFAVRKAQYHWGWDWGPVLMTAGPWRPVRLEVFHSRIAVLRVKYQVATGLDVVSGTIFAKVEGQAGRTVAFSIASEDRTLFEGTSVVNEDGMAEIAFDLQQPSLWYPHGYGPQPIYEVSAVLTNNGIKLDKSVKNTGFRLAQLVQERDDVGQSFYFRINGVDVFCGGSNWIPADSFLPTVSAGRYRKWLQSMVQGNQVMVRYVSVNPFMAIG
jgi:beta-mannosidase